MIDSGFGDSKLDEARTRAERASAWMLARWIAREVCKLRFVEDYSGRYARGGLRDGA